MNRIPLFGLIGLCVAACVDTASQGTVAPTASTVIKSTSSAYQKPGQCMIMFGQASSVEGAVQIAQSVQNEVEWYGDVVGVYRLQDGNYAAVRDFMNEDTIKSTREGEQSIARLVGFGDYPPQTRCSDGSEIAEYTGIRSFGTKHEGKDLSIAGAMARGAIAGAAAIREAASSPSSMTELPSATASGSDGTGDQEAGIKVDSSGTVSENGKTIGRVEYSWGYKILCWHGYNYGSDSVFGGSFKADVDSMDEAVAVLLDACKR